MTTEIRHSPEPDLVGARSPWGIAAVALVAGLLQVVASVVLGLAKLDRFLAAANEGATVYMVVAALVAAAALSIWMVRERPPIAVALL
ncbi:MAG TPA: hypothetical protein VK034_24650, partial [Enhygromyxa sp.]|nr:hypothetical protein [Enhygromyxa sp.]